ncbi:aminodeoxychorismate synthase component I [Sphingobium sp. EP60837]|uniref:aminodeoxychorismate synthase component I n=1 Tax=Sphingobium sp. EP60837 TaxID=1855519 RepID=UPI0007DCC9EB|nr:aminodeoxychorismate synthase component I [Sphingobium sp. EP60837]ANI80241.1 Aminodeoxychorismate synthase [Sphingobium sp. EP60837]
MTLHAPLELLLCPRGWGDTNLNVDCRRRPSPPDGSPFLLLDDARDGGSAYLFQEPLGIITAFAADDVAPALERARAALAAGYYVAGYLTYEAGNAFDPAGKSAGLESASREPLLWMAIFSAPLLLNPKAWLPPPTSARLNLMPDLARSDYLAAVSEIIGFIEAGDIYQANFTYQSRVAVPDHPFAHYSRLRRSQAAGWGGLLHNGRHHFLSFSPELMVAASATGDIWSKPMKGTAKRQASPARDREAARQLRASSKDQSENLMIVDLIRNDLSLVSRVGSIVVPSLFEVEAYPTIFQMTSTIRASLLPGRDSIDIIRNLFPCGSITGAPKLRSREIISRIERTPRGIYTGAIGFFAPNGACAFNVAIRTLVVAKDEQAGKLGLGSGITVGSDGAAEWDECLAKANFLLL